MVILNERFYSLIGSFAILGIRFFGRTFFIDKNKIIFLAFTPTWSLCSTFQRTSLHSHPLYAPGKRRLTYRKHRLHRNLYYYWAEEEKTFWFRLETEANVEMMQWTTTFVAAANGKRLLSAGGAWRNNPELCFVKCEGGCSCCYINEICLLALSWPQPLDQHVSNYLSFEFIKFKPKGLQHISINSLVVVTLI